MMIICLLALLLLSNTVYSKYPKSDQPRKIAVKNEKKHTRKKDEDNLINKALTGNRTVEKKVLKNGMTVLVHQVHTIPKVSIQLWYNVGSKDENTGERGIAHLLEHMVFKGTQHNGAIYLSESDLDMTTHMLSGSCNAFTSYDYTGYLFNFPSHHYKEAFPILADCMSNCRFDDQMLNSEMKAVIQELKLNKDQYTSN
jgi:zinc protease